MFAIEAIGNRARDKDQQCYGQKFCQAEDSQIDLAPGDVVDLLGQGGDLQREPDVQQHICPDIGTN